LIQHSPLERTFAASLAALAGFIDAAGFLASGGFFFSFMSGNSTRLGINAAELPPNALLPLGIILCFVLGAAIGAIVAHFAGRKRPFFVLALVTVLITLGSGFGHYGSLLGAGAFLTLAMGCKNNVFKRDGEVSIGLTYMTGNLVKLGQGLAGALLGNNEHWKWLSYLTHWLGLVVGAIAGAYAYAHFNWDAIWIASATAFIATLCAAIFRIEDD